MPSPGRFESGLPVTDGYVLTAPMKDVFGRGQQNDVPLLAGSNSDEGSNFPSFRTLAAYREDARKTLGPFADEFFTLYPAADDAQARRANEHAVRDTRIGWPNFEWAKTQARTGHAKVFYYYFSHHPSAPPNENYVENLGKDLGAYHGAELAYVFGNFVPPGWPWTDADRKLSVKVQQYWVNFATSGDPNGPGLPPWPTFDPAKDSVLHIDSTISAGPPPFRKNYAFWDKVAAGWKGAK